MDNTNAFVAAQARCDAVAQEFGGQAPRWLMAESLRDYRVRLLSEYKAYSPQWKGANLAVIANDPAALGVVEAAIYKDAMHIATHPTNEPGTPLVARTRVDNSGRRLTTFSGDPIEAWKPFLGPGVRYLVGINKRAGAA